MVKDDGLAAGKGVLVTDDRAAAVAHGHRVLDAGGAVLIEEYLDGPEVSLFALSDGTTVVPLIPAQDAKRRDDGDGGPNTGGMGAYAPLPWAPDGPGRRRRWPRCCSRRSTRWPAAASRSPGCSTPGWR